LRRKLVPRLLAVVALAALGLAVATGVAASRRYLLPRVVLRPPKGSYPQGFLGDGSALGAMHESRTLTFFSLATGAPLVPSIVFERSEFPCGRSRDLLLVVRGKTLAMRSPETGRVVSEFTVSAPIRGAAISYAGDRLALDLGGGHVEVRSPDGALQRVVDVPPLGAGEELFCLRLSPRGDLLTASKSSFGPLELFVWSARDGRLLQRVANACLPEGFTRDGAVVAWAHPESDTLREWSSRDGTLIREFAAEAQASLSDSGEALAIVHPHSIEVVSPDTGELKRRVPVQNGAQPGWVRLSREGDLLAVSYDDGTRMEVWDVPR
jgi:hypothetical protein